MTLITRRERQRQVVRTAILDAARDLAQREGWRAVSMRKIAAEIDYTPTVIYEHFGGKDELVLAIAQDGFQRLDDQVRQAISRATQPADVLKKVAEVYYAFSVQHQPIYEAMFDPGIGYPFDLQMPEINRLYTWLGQTIAEILQRTLTGREQMKLSIQLWSHLHGLVTFLHANNGNVDELTPAELINDAVSSFIKANSK